MRPTIGECRPSRIHHFLAQWILFHPILILDALLDAHIDGPSALLRVFQVLGGWVIVFFPSIKGDLTMETHDVIGIGYSWFITEAGFRELLVLISDASLDWD